jgi:PKD domain
LGLSRNDYDDYDPYVRFRSCRPDQLVRGLAMARLLGGLVGVVALLLILVVGWAFYNGLAPERVTINKGGGEVIVQEGYRPPKVSIVCPSNGNLTGDSYNAVFGGKTDVSASGLPATLTLEYGDGRHYTTSRLEHFNSAYRHVYTQKGNFTVRARVQDSRGRGAEDKCSFSLG